MGGTVPTQLTAKLALVLSCTLGGRVALDSNIVTLL